MSRATRMQQIIQQHFNPTHFEIVDQSSGHRGHAGYAEGGESHFDVTIVSDFFEGKNRVQRQRAVYAHFQPLFDEGLHALSLQLYTPSEYVA